MTSSHSRQFFKTLTFSLLVCLAAGIERSSSDVYRVFTNVQEVRGARPKDVPNRWKELIGDYANTTDTVSVLERDGCLGLFAGDGTFLALREGRKGVYSFERPVSPDDTVIIFRSNVAGRATVLERRRESFKRLSFGEEDGHPFRITPLASVEVLRLKALNAKPPQEGGTFAQPDLVEVTALDSTIKLDIRYATTNNFMGAVFYSQARALLQRAAAEALVRAHRRAKQLGYGLLIHDAYRPWYITKMFWDATPNHQKMFVADPAKGSRHNRGCAVDLSLCEFPTGQPVPMVSGYDEFSHRAFSSYGGGTSLQRWHRDLLRKVMEAEGFRVYEWEWWHFDYKDCRRYRIGTMTFEEIQHQRQ